MQTFSRSLILLLSLFAIGAAQACGSFTTAYRFDLAGQVVGVISPLEGAAREGVRNTYDSEGRIIKIERGVLAACHSEDVLPANWPNFDVRLVIDKTYDAMGRLLSERRSGPTLTQYSYDTVGRLECTAVRMNPAVYGSIAALSACQLSTQGSHGPDRITRHVYDVVGRVVTEQRAYNTSIQQNYAAYGYTPNGRQDWVEDANGNRTDFTYDGFDRLNRMNFPQVSVGAHAASTTDYEAYGYDNNSNLTSKRLRSEETITYGFDALNRLDAKNLAGTGTVSYTYDNFGLNETAQISGGAGISNVYDGFGRLTEATSSSSAGSLTLTYGYDEDGNRIRMTWPGGTYVQYTYDGRNRMKQVRENNAVVSPGLLADYSYDVLSRRTNLARGNGTATAYDYDTAWRLFSLSQDLASTSRDLSFGFSYNSAGQVTNRAVSNDAYSYFSMMQSKSYSRDGRNQYTTVGGTTYGYDRRGNLTSDGIRSFTYDLENHLLSVTGGNTPVNLTYDSNGRLLTSASGGVTTRYLYDGDKLVAEYNGSTLVRRYVHGASVDEPLVWYEGAGLTDRRWLHTDHQGSVVATSSGTGAGTVYAYSAYGEPAYENWGGSRFRYTGQFMLPEAKLYHYKARVYDPVLGRFLQTDPVGYKDDINLYAYVGNDPLNNFDPTGKGLVTTTIKFIAKGGDIAATTAGIVEDATTIVNPAVPLPGRIGAALSLSTKVLPVSAKDVKVGWKILENAQDGAAREKKIAAQLQADNPGAKIQNQTYLRDADGKIARDPITGEARRVDHAVIRGDTAETVETTSLTADKTAQSAKEQRIRDAGGTYIRDRQTRKLCRVETGSRIVRCE